jgi:DNA invertase Pin-like site-specific DNA recombinase
VKSPAVLYAAKSTVDKNASIPTQFREGRELAEAEGREVVDEFKDEKKSAYSGDRGPGLAAARALAEKRAAAHGGCHLIIQHSDRLARGDGVQAAHLVEYALWAMKCGVKIRSIQDPQTFEHDDLLYAVVTGQRNHEDSRRKSLSIKAGRRRRREAGGWGGGPPPYGFRIHPADKTLVEDPTEAPIVRRIFDEYAGGRPFRSICAKLESDGVRPRRGRLWRVSTLRQMITNPAYVGKMRHYEDVVEGVHDGLVDEATWDKARRLAEAAATARKGRPPGARHLLRGGLLRSECGSTMVCRSEGRGRYVCERVHAGLGGCECKAISKPVVDSAVFAFFQQVGLDVESTREQVAGARNRKLAEVRATLEEARKERGRAEDRLARVRRDYTDGKLDAEDWTAFRDELTAELEGASAAVDRLAGRLAEVEQWSDVRDAEQDTLTMLADIREAVAGGTADEERVDAVRAAIMRLFARFELHRIAPGERVHGDLAWAAGGDLAIVPVVRPQAIEGFASLQPIFRREPLYGAANNERDAHASRLRRKLDPEDHKYVVNCWSIGYRLVDG